MASKGNESTIYPLTLNNQRYQQYKETTSSNLWKVLNKILFNILGYQKIKMHQPSIKASSQKQTQDSTQHRYGTSRTCWLLHMIQVCLPFFFNTFSLWFIFNWAFTYLRFPKCWWHLHLERVVLFSKHVHVPNVSKTRPWHVGKLYTA